MPERFTWRRGPLFVVVSLLLTAAVPSLADDAASRERMKKDIFFLASDECQGRGVDTEGINKAAEHIASEFKKAGLKPGGKDGTYFQPFKVSAGTGKIQGGSFVLKGPLGQTITLEAGKDYQVLPLASSGKVTAPVVFAGYGVQAKQANYDDFKDLDVAGKVVVVLRRVPRWDNDAVPFAGNKEAHAGLENKIGLAELHKAAAVILVNDRSEVKGGDKFANLPGIGSSGIPVVQLRRGLFDMMLISSKGTSLTDLEKDIDRDLKPRGGVLPGWTATIEADVVRTAYDCKNIIGVLEGSGPLADETIVIGAHYDHLGFGGFGSLAKDKTKKEIHHGADDNGSGTTTVLELARRFAAMKERKGRRLVFILFSGEERGLLGSKYYCNKEPLFPLAKTAAMVNLDMVGRLKDDNKLRAEGVGTAKGFEELIDNLNKDFSFKLQKSKGGFGPSDHDSFCRKEIPVFFFWTGLHEDYHRPSDTADRINLDGMVKIANLTEKVIDHLRTMAERPAYVAIAEPKMPVGGGDVPRLRIGIDYGDESNKGVLVETVVKDGPGDKGGIKSGDRIVAINGMPTPNMTSYMAVMRQQKANVELEVTVDREGKQMKLKVTPIP
jgi:hypothetical protein